MKSILHRIYGSPKGEEAFSRLESCIKTFSIHKSEEKKELFNQADAILITYGDSLLKHGEPCLQTLHRFCLKHLKGAVSGIHILPFFPYSSDDGFSIMDFKKVRPDLGTWKDVRALGLDFKLMVDLVANHISAKSDWFQFYLAGQKGFADLAIEANPKTDLSKVTRPRTFPLLTEFEKKSGARVHVWTTFSADQIDLNYKSLDVLENMVDVLLFYISNSAVIIRLDAIAYLWKKIGTSCIHLPQTHDMVKLFRAILDKTAPKTALVTETNVPHQENISYFGNGTDEAQMVYNFSLPPLLLDALATGRAGDLSNWAKGLGSPSANTTFFNFTASHDGIGVRPLEGILPLSRINALIDRVRKNGGGISEKQNADGSKSPYELNITYLDALKNPDITPDPLLVPRFLASQAVALALPGVPGIYIHSLLCSRNWMAGVKQTGLARTINREKLAIDTVETELSDPGAFRASVFYPFLNMIKIRSRQPAFHPNAQMEIVDLDHRIFGVKRFSKKQTLLAATNLSSDHLAFALPGGIPAFPLMDLLTRKRFEQRSIPLGPYQTVWLSG